MLLPGPARQLAGRDADHPREAGEPGEARHRESSCRQYREGERGRRSATRYVRESVASDGQGEHHRRHGGCVRGSKLAAAGDTFTAKVWRSRLERLLHETPGPSILILTSAH